jgi:hypothetical protein
MSEDSEGVATCDGLQDSIEDSPLSEERRRELVPKFAVLMAELAKLRELEPEDGEPATPWPWRGDDHDS